MRYGRFASSARERREADLFLADLLGYAPPPAYGEQQPSSPSQVCGFFRPDNTVRTLAQLRNAIVTQCNTEWSAWHFSGGAPKPECDSSVFGRLIGYYLATERTILSDALRTIQATARGSISYAPVLGPAAPTSTQIAAIRALLIAGAPPGTPASMINDAISHAREGHDSVGPFRAWSAAFVSACVRGAAIAEGIETVILPARTPAGQDTPLQPSFRHTDYVLRARADALAGTPGRYHAFDPSARNPQLADIIVQDRKDDILPSQVRTLATLPPRVELHGDIVVEIAPDSVVTIGGNVADGVRKRRYPRDVTTGRLLTIAPRLYAQEDDAGTLPALPGVSCQALPDKSTRRIFALLSLVEECRTPPPPANAGSGSGSGGR